MTGRPSLAATLGHPPVAVALAVALLAWATALGRGNTLLHDPDVFSHIAVGRWILAHGEVPQADIFSHSMPGARWVAHEWLSEIGIALIYDRFGWVGLAAATATCLAIAMGLLVHALTRYLPVAAALLATVGAWSLCYPHLQARPHAVILPLLVVWTASLVAARAAGRAPPLWLALVMVLWANLHGSHVFGLGLAGMFAAEAVFESSNRREAWIAVRDWGVFCALTFAVEFVTPLGVAGVTFPFEVARMSYALSWINEWQSPNMQGGHPIEAWLMLALLGTMSLGLRFPITRIAMFLLLLHLALSHQRHGELLGICAPLMLAPALTEQLRALDGTPVAATWRGWVRRLGPPAIWRKAALAGAAAVALAMTVVRLPSITVPRTYAPSAAIEAARAHGLPGQVFNTYNMGGYLMFVGIPPFFDGRLDMYGEPFLRRFNSLPDLPRLLADYRIGWTLFEPKDRHVTALDSLPDWQRLYADDLAVVHVRRK